MSKVSNKLKEFDKRVHVARKSSPEGQPNRKRSSAILFNVVVVADIVADSRYRFNPFTETRDR